jgi:MoCo/4Fe-4S cofactor protein with predicted Tat translocation signal
MSDPIHLPLVGEPAAAPATPKTQWRSLDDLAGTPEFRAWASREFPGYTNVREGAGEADGPGFDRRRFVQLMSASVALAGVSMAGCRRPNLQIRPFTKPPEDQVPGLPTFYATTFVRGNHVVPLVVEDDGGHPTKVEGNPVHPASLGSTDAFAQASVLDLYHPDRSRVVLKNGRTSTWEEFDTFVAAHVAKLDAGKGLAFLAEPTPSPALRLLRQHLADNLKGAAWYEYAPLTDDNALAGAELAFGEKLVSTVHYDKADVVVSLDCDFLGTDGSVIDSRRYARRRRIAKGDAPKLNRLYVVENTLTITGGAADHRLRIPAAHVVDFAVALARELNVGGDAVKGLKTAVDFREKAPKWAVEVAKDLAANKEKAVVVVGERQPPVVHALAHLINQSLGSNGKSVTFAKPAAAPPAKSLADLVTAVKKGEIDTLVFVEGNPAFTAPADLKIDAELLANVKFLVRLSQHVDETSVACAAAAAKGKTTSFHLPGTHYLEQWGDAETPDGTYSPVQPLVAPLVDGAVSPLELVAKLARYGKPDGYEITAESFRRRSGKEGDNDLRAWLHEGVLRNSARPAVEAKVGGVEKVVAAYKAPPAVGLEHLEVSFHACYRLADGRFAGNAWLQELPDPITKLTWDNAAIVSPATAEALRVKTQDKLRLTLGKQSIEVAVWVQPGQADGSISLKLGGGRRHAGRVGSILQPDAEGRLNLGEDHGGGFDVYPLRTTDAYAFAVGVKAEKTRGTYALASTQEHFTIQHDRPLVVTHTAAAYARTAAAYAKKHASHDHHDHDHGKDEKHGHGEQRDLSLILPLDPDQGWGMVIDLQTCTGCGACMVACQAENNVPVVGKGEVVRGREMHWIRIDRYFLTDADDRSEGREKEADEKLGHTLESPGVAVQPVACVHCERAPCELVCPVNAAVHSPEGLNLQVYNRCIGTRYCSNNCPYKARRFNYFDFNQRPLDQLRLGPLTEKGVAELLKMSKNPDVTVRMRGVMEKCTYCVQRIERGKAGAKLQAVQAGRSDFRVPDGVITPACAQACAAEAIVFGNVKDRNSRVAKLKADNPRDYALLDEELNVKPRTSYLAAVRNPNPALLPETKETKA